MRPSFVPVILLVTGIFFSLSLSAGKISTEKIPVTLAPIFRMQEFHQRNGLPNVFKKIATQRQVRIGYIGGSITEAKDGWRDLTFNWFRLTYPQTAFYQVNATIGGTGSNLGVFRMEHDVFSGKPGAMMRFKFKGRVLGIYDCIGPGTGTIEISVDGNKEEIARFDQWCDNYRKHSFFVKELEDKVHDVEICVLDKKIDKAPIMLKKKITIVDQAKYSGRDWYPANVMIVGELVK